MIIYLAVFAWCCTVGLLWGRRQLINDRVRAEQRPPLWTVNLQPTVTYWTFRKADWREPRPAPYIPRHAAVFVSAGVTENGQEK